MEYLIDIQYRELWPLYLQHPFYVTILCEAAMLLGLFAYISSHILKVTIPLAAIL